MNIFEEKNNWSFIQLNRRRYIHPINYQILKSKDNQGIRQYMAIYIQNKNFIK